MYPRTVFALGFTALLTLVVSEPIPKGLHYPIDASADRSSFAEVDHAAHILTRDDIENVLPVEDRVSAEEQEEARISAVREVAHTLMGAFADEEKLDARQLQDDVQDDLLDNLDGAAVEDSNGRKHAYVEGEEITINRADLKLQQRQDMEWCQCTCDGDECTCVCL